MIALGSDHAGFPLKEAIKKYLDGEGVEYIDCGAYDTQSCDYPLQAEKTCLKILNSGALLRHRYRNINGGKQG